MMPVPPTVTDARDELDRAISEYRGLRARLIRQERSPQRDELVLQFRAAAEAIQHRRMELEDAERAELLADPKWIVAQRAEQIARADAQEREREQRIAARRARP